MTIHRVYRWTNGHAFACDQTLGKATEAWEAVTCPDCLAHKAPPVSPSLDYALSSLRRAADAGQSWSVSPTEAAALVAEVERLRAEVSFLRSSVPPLHPTDYGHEVWMEEIQAAEARGQEAERARIVADLRSAAPSADHRVLLLIDNPIALTLEACAERYERGDHAPKEKRP